MVYKSQHSSLIRFATWFMDEDVEEQNLPFNQPTSVFISGPAKTENTLSGSINQNNENKNITLWDNNDIKQTSKTPPWAWFLIGLILIPLTLSVISILVFTISNSGFFNEEYSKNPPERSEDVIFEDEYFEVYIFTISSRFADIFAEQNYWDLNIEFRSTTDSHEWDSYISGNYEYIHQNSITDDTGMMWYNTDIHDNSPEETVVYVRVIEDTVHVAIKSDTPKPTYVHYYFEENDGAGDSDTLFWGNCMIWPITIIVGAIWGFRTNRKSLAYGILTSAIVAIIVMGLFSFLWFIGW